MRSALKRTGLVLAGAAVLTFGIDYATFAATGSSLILGKTNKASKTTTIQNTKSGAALSLKTKSSATAPLKVNGKGKVINLNADRIDGLDSTQLQRKVGSCGAGGAVTGVNASGGVTCGLLPRSSTWTLSSVPAADSTFDMFTRVAYPAGSYLVTGSLTTSAATGVNATTAPVSCSIFHATEEHAEETRVAMNVAASIGAPKFATVTTVVNLSAPRVLNLYCAISGGAEASPTIEGTHLDIVRLDGAAAGGFLDVDN